MSAFCQESCTFRGKNIASSSCSGKSVVNLLANPRFMSEQTFNCWDLTQYVQFWNNHSYKKKSVLKSSHYLCYLHWIYTIKHLLLVNFFGIQFQTRKRSDFPIFPFSISEYISSSSELNIKFVHCCYIQWLIHRSLYVCSKLANFHAGQSVSFPVLLACGTPVPFSSFHAVYLLYNSNLYRPSIKKSVRIGTLTSNDP